MTSGVVLGLICGVLIGLAVAAPLVGLINRRSFRKAHGGRTPEEVSRGPFYWGRDLSKHPLRAKEPRR